MDIINQHTKKIMEECKLRAADAGLCFDDESLEYIVTNQDMIELGPKGMIPTMYDYWVHDLEVIKGKKEYELYPNNPYETVINSRPALSFYNDNNPDWLNVMIFYHVLGHIDFMQNNCYFRHTWNDDFVGLALADKRHLNSLRTKHGRWVDYVIEFARGVDNICGYYDELAELNIPGNNSRKRLDYFFDVFLQKVRHVSEPEYLRELNNFNTLKRESCAEVESEFIASIKNSYPEFDTNYEQYIYDTEKPSKDILEYLMDHSPFVNKDENQWMKPVIQIVRNTALYFAPQMRTKILNEGWATYWHHKLFIEDERIKGHEVDFARINAYVTAIPKQGLNPYAIGLRLFEFVEQRAEKGKMGYGFDKIMDHDLRRNFNNYSGAGLKSIFDLRTNWSDFNFINTFVDQDFVDRHNLVIIGQRINAEHRSREYYIKSKKAADYKQMIIKGLIHPPHITVDDNQTDEHCLHLKHFFEGKQLIPEFIENVLTGLEFLWGGSVKIHSKIVYKKGPRNIIYCVKERKMTKNEYKK